MYRGTTGIDRLNTITRDLLSPFKDWLSLVFGEMNFRKGGKVLHLINDAKLNIFNGDIGYITDLTPAKYTESKQDELYVSFDDTEVICPRNEWHKITLVYTMSIHKSQGSGFQVVILPITRQSCRLLQRNLVYTAITRSKSRLVILGEIAAFDYAIESEGAERSTYLVQRFTSSTQKEESIDLQTEISQQTSPKAGNEAEKITFPTSPQTNISKEGNIRLTLDIAENEQTQTEQEPKIYRLTEEDLAFINPMIGITQADIEQFFKK